MQMNGQGVNGQYRIVLWRGKGWPIISRDGAKMF